MPGRLARIAPLLLLALVAAGSVRADEPDYTTPERVMEFADYLKNEADYLRAAAEYERYLVLAGDGPNTDQVLISIGACCVLGKQPDRALAYFERVLKDYAQGSCSDEAAYQIAFIHYNAGRFCQSLEFTQRHPARSREHIERQSWLKSACHMNLKQWDQARSNLASELAGDGEATTELRRLADAGASTKHKSPAVAGFLSALVPGAGKLYAGRGMDGLHSFMAVAMMARVAVRANRDDPGSARTWIYTGLASGFYLGNIYGSAAAASNHNRAIEADLNGRIGVVLNWSID